MSPLTAPKTHIDIQLAKEPITPAERTRRMQSLGFGKVFTEYMVVIPYNEATGWGRGALKPYGPIQLDPRRRCCTTARPSSRASRPTASPTAT